jgi:hypothetical protein
MGTFLSVADHVHERLAALDFDGVRRALQTGRELVRRRDPLAVSARASA